MGLELNTIQQLATNSTKGKVHSTRHIKGVGYLSFQPPHECFTRVKRQRKARKL